MTPPRRIASLFDRLISAVDSSRGVNDEFAVETATNLTEQGVGHHIGICGDPDLQKFERFTHLPHELQTAVFRLSLQPYVVDVYSSDATLDGDAELIPTNHSQHTATASNDLYRIITNEPRNPRTLFVLWRPPRTIPLLHTCRASRAFAIRQYGLPKPENLLFDPTLDHVRLCGRTPPQTPQYPRLSTHGLLCQVCCSPSGLTPFSVFSRRLPLRQSMEPAFDLSAVKAMQINLSGFSTRIGICLRPEALFNTALSSSCMPSTLNQERGRGSDWQCTATTTAAVAVNDLINVLEWLGWALPNLIHLDFTPDVYKDEESSSSREIRKALTSARRESTLVDLANFRACVVAVEERQWAKSASMCLSSLQSLSIHGLKCSL